EALVGNGATVLDGAVVGPRSLIAAGATVPPGMAIPGEMLAAGVPARITGEISGGARRGGVANPGLYRAPAPPRAPRTHTPPRAGRHGAGTKPVAGPAGRYRPCPAGVRHRRGAEPQLPPMPSMVSRTRTSVAPASSPCAAITTTGKWLSAGAASTCSAVDVLPADDAGSIGHAGPGAGAAAATTGGSRYTGSHGANIVRPSSITVASTPRAVQASGSRSRTR